MLCSPPRRPSAATATSCTRCRSSGPSRSSPATGAGPASPNRSGEPARPDERLPRQLGPNLVLAPPPDRAVAELDDDQTVVLAIAAVGVLANPDVPVHDEVMPVQVHRRRVLAAEEVVQLGAALVPLLVRRLHVDRVVGEAGQRSLRVSGVPALGDGLHQSDERVVVHAPSRSKRPGSNGAGSKGGSVPRTSAAASSALPAPRITPSEPCPVATNSPSRAQPSTGRSSGETGRTPDQVDSTVASASAGTSRDACTATILGTSRS